MWIENQMLIKDDGTLLISGNVNKTTFSPKITNLFQYFNPKQCKDNQSERCEPSRALGYANALKLTYPHFFLNRPIQIDYSDFKPTISGNIP